MKRKLVMAVAVFLIAAPIAIAQTTTPPPATPPAATTTPIAPPPTTTPAPSDPAAPTPSAAPTTPAPMTENQSSAAPQGCRTRKEAGEACACLSDTSRIGTSTAHPDGHNVCVRPD